MKILIVTNHFYPETFRVNDIAFDLAAKGEKVTVITCIPNYPIGKTFDGYGLFKRRRENVKGVDVIRVPVIPRGKGTGGRLMLNYLSYLLTASVCALIMSFRKKYDCIFVHETSPVTVGIPAIIVKKIQKIPLYFWVLDLWPESLTAAGGVTNKYILHLFTSITKWIYTNSDKILISSKGFEQSICQKGDFKKKLVYFPNWGEDVFTDTIASEEDIPSFPDGFKIMYAGNIGEAQNFEAIMNAALHLKDTEVKWILVGDGRKREWVESFIEKHQLEDHVFLPGRYPIEMMPSFFTLADAMLVSLKDTYIFNITVPAKLQAYMAASKPVLAMLNGEGSSLIKEADCGFVVKAGDTQALVDVIVHKVLSNETFKEKGKNGFVYFDKYFRKEICMHHLFEIVGCE